ncbi:MAG: DNA-binding protein 1 [Nevskia sp.]|nr:DNA-binding protein 1 [Nevskia sp.]
MSLEILSTSLSEKFGIPKSQANEQIHTIIEHISTALAKGERFALPGLGSLSVAQRAARTGRNPQTGAAIDIPAKKVIKFSPASSLDKTVNAK